MSFTLPVAAIPDIKTPEEFTLRSYRSFDTFESHVAACRKKLGMPMPGAWYEEPSFHFSNADGLYGDGRKISAPAHSHELDFGLGLGLVIGREGRNIPVEKAWEYIFGFTIINDFTARDLERFEAPLGIGPSKCKDFATAVGPEIVPWQAVRDAINEEDRLALKMEARVNGQSYSTGNGADMHYSWTELVAHASRDATLYPGDLLGSGTMNRGSIMELDPQTVAGWLQPGDVVELEVIRLGVLHSSIVSHDGTDEDAPSSQETRSASATR